MDLALKIIKQHKREFIILKERKPIIHLLNYVDVLNFNCNEFDIDFFLKINYKIGLIYNLYLYRRRHFKDFDYKDSLKVIEDENLCIIRFEADYITRVQPKNVNLTTMVIHTLKNGKINEINVSGMLYCVFLM
jgi:hypothetical protein